MHAAPRRRDAAWRRNAVRRGVQTRGEAGFTLVEILVSLLLLTGLAMALGFFYPAASASGGFGRNMTYATLLAQQQMEEIKAKTFTYVTPTNYITSTTFTQWGITFTRRVTVTLCAVTTTAPCPNPITSAQSPNLTVVAVTVAWGEPSSTLPQAVTLTTMVQNYY
jgi:type II secretory pathway pseudopilin PulG